MNIKMAVYSIEHKFPISDYFFVYVDGNMLEEVIKEFISVLEEICHSISYHKFSQKEYTIFCNLSSRVIDANTAVQFISDAANKLFNKQDTGITFDEIFWNPPNLKNVDEVQIAKMIDAEGATAYHCESTYKYIVKLNTRIFKFQSKMLMVLKNIIELSEQQYISMCNENYGEYCALKTVLEHERFEKYEHYQQIMQNLFWLAPLIK